MGDYGRVLLMCFIWVLFVGILVNRAATATAVKIIPSGETIKLLKFTGKQKLALNQDVGINYVSKRRVPNGPDPIHNRRTGKSRQPPDRV